MPKRKEPQKGWQDWPKSCPGGCGNLSRPTHSRKDQFPGTVPSVNNEGWCDKCRRLALGKPARHLQNTGTSRAYVTDPKVRERREAELMEWRRRFEADRRARGIPEEGILFEGEVAVVAQQPSWATLVIDKPGKCKNGHDYDFVDDTGRRRCLTCMRANGQKAGEKRKLARMEPQDDAPHGRCKNGHPYVMYADGKKNCRPCRNEQKARWRKSRREAGLPANYGPAEVRRYEAMIAEQGEAS